MNKNKYICNRGKDFIYFSKEKKNWTKVYFFCGAGSGGFDGALGDGCGRRNEVIDVSIS
jgi:hypothetical protein